VNLSEERGEVVVDGKRLETLWIGPQQSGRPVIVMLHGGLGSIALWKDFPELLYGVA
jgi:pimeloyl-ACP methyl ester carboxylesterase